MADEFRVAISSPPKIFFVANQIAFDSRSSASTMRTQDKNVRLGCVMESEVRMESPPSSRFSGRRIHFIGIGGCGMSGLARMLLDAGAIISGSDIQNRPPLYEPASRGASFSEKKCGKLLPADLDLGGRTAGV